MRCSAKSSLVSDQSHRLEAISLIAANKGKVQVLRPELNRSLATGLGGFLPLRSLPSAYQGRAWLSLPSARVDR